MNRRSVFPSLAGGLLAASCGFGDTPVCRPVDYGSKYRPGLFHNACPWQPPKLDNRPRRLWSKLTQAEKNVLRNQLYKAYSAIAALPGLAGWTGQGWLHSYYCSSAVDVHSTAAFLPWHRAFVFFHEQMLQTYDKDLRLPVWDWENSLEVPAAYNGWIKPPNIAFDCQLLRTPVTAPIDRCLLQSWLLSGSPEEFLGYPAYTSGPPPTPAPQAYGGPHSLIHSSVGRLFMGIPTYAALDPLFFAHHTNVDRYFSAWRLYYKNKPGFEKPQWPSDDWYFYDARQQKVVTFKSDWFANTYLDDTEPLGYCYSEPAQVRLYDFDFIPAISTLMVKLDETRLRTFLESLAQLLSVSELSKMVMALLKDSGNLIDLFNQTVQKFGINLPGKVNVGLPKANITPGRYYALGVQAAGSKDPAPAIGGFGVFAHVHHSVWWTPAALCVRPAAFQVLIEALPAGHARLVYGDLSADGQSVQQPKPVVALDGFQIRYPKDLSILLQ